MKYSDGRYSDVPFRKAFGYRYSDAQKGGIVAKEKLIKIVGLIVFVIFISVAINLFIPRLIGIGLEHGAAFLDKVFHFNILPTVEQRLSIYSFLYCRPEIFIFLAAKAKWSLLEIFLTFSIFTTLIITIIWFGAAVGEKIARKSNKKEPGEAKKIFDNIEKKLKRLNKGWISYLIRRYGRYAVFIPFIFPIIPLSETVAIIAVKLLKIKYGLWILIGINALKGLIILLPFMNFF